MLFSTGKLLGLVLVFDMLHEIELYVVNKRAQFKVEVVDL